MGIPLLKMWPGQKCALPVLRGVLKKGKQPLPPGFSVQDIPVVDITPVAPVSHDIRCYGHIATRIDGPKVSLSVGGSEDGVIARRRHQEPASAVGLDGIR